MAEAPPIEPVPSSSETTETITVSEKVVSDVKDDEGPSPKKRKVAIEKEPSEKLEHRLGGILCCAVCLDLPGGLKPPGDLPKLPDSKLPDSKLPDTKGLPNLGTK